ncbi:hypothetical protein [Bacillus toyonensis]|uniref:hypothetical protein n=1 Tax=Bacillus toyonensis TaxID=155322 RepID=UPI001C0C0D0F|nr:hypothetical protein [Bacillus toyonensis]MBU4642904.1 hypothetical protein [Bacillus toyonensis]
MRKREDWDVLCDACDKIITHGIATNSGENYCSDCHKKLVYRNKDNCQDNK